MIYKFDTAIEYQQLLIALHATNSDYDESLVWDLSEGIDIREVPVSIYACRNCNLAVVYFRDEEPATKCWSCGSNMLGDQTVSLIIQGDTVLHRRPE